MAGNGVIGSLRVVLGMDTAQFEEGLKKSQSKLSAFAGNAKVAGAAAGAALVAAATAIGAAAKAGIDRADQLEEMSQKVGVAVTELSRLSYAADLTGVGLEGLAGGLKKLSVSMSDAAGGATSKAAKAFKTLGVSVTDAGGKMRDNSAVLVDLADKFAGMQDSAGKTALAMAVFGKSGADLIPMLNEGGDSLKAMMADADALGLTLSQETATAAATFNDNLFKLKAVGQGVSQQIAAGLLPGLQSLSETFVSGAKSAEFMSAVTTTLNGTLKAVSVTGVVLGAVFDATFKTVNAAAKAVMQILRGDLKGALASLNQPLDSFEGIGARISKVWNATGQTVKMTAQTAKAAAPVIDQASNKVKKSLSEQEKAHKDAVEELERYIETVKREQATAGLTSQQVKIMDAQAMALKAIELGYNNAAAALLRYADALIQAEQIQKQVVETSYDIEKSGTEASEDWGKSIEEAAERAREKIRDLPYIIDDVWYALKNKDWRRALEGLSHAIEGIEYAFSSLGTTADKINAVAGVANGVGQLVGGKTGKALSSAAMGAQIGSTVLGAFLPGIGNAIGAVVGGIMGGLGSIVGGKPSNHAAIAQISGDSYNIAGNKRTEETTQAAAAAADAVLASQKVLSDAGISLSKSVTAIDIGTRDLTHIFLSTGEELRSAVGDPAAAAETAMMALLDGATFANEAQKHLVESMLAAGKGFDDIAAAIQRLDAAQDLPQALADEIQRLTDPKAYDVEQLRRAQEDRRKAIEAEAAAGFLTSEQLAALNVQLAQLDQLELDEVLKKYAETVSAATVDYTAQIDKAKSNLERAYDAEASRLEDISDRFKDIADALASVRKDLMSEIAGSSDPRARDAVARARFQSLSAAAAGGNAEAAAALPDAIKEFLSAAEAVAPDAASLRRDRQAALAAATKGEQVARGQQSAAEQQLAQLKAQVDAVLQVDNSVMSVNQAIDELIRVTDLANAAQTGAMDAVATQLAAQVANANQQTELVANQTYQLAALTDRMGYALEQIAVSTGKQARIMDDWDGDGMPDTRNVA